MGQGDVHWAKEKGSGPRRPAVGQGDVPWAEETGGRPRRRAVGQEDAQWAKEMCSGRKMSLINALVILMKSCRFLKLKPQTKAASRGRTGCGSNE